MRSVIVSPYTMTRSFGGASLRANKCTGGNKHDPSSHHAPPRAAGSCRECWCLGRPRRADAQHRHGLCPERRLQLAALQGPDGRGADGDRSARRPDEEVPEGIPRPDRHQARHRGHSRAAGTPEGRDRAELGQAVVRRLQLRLPRPEAPVREGRLAAGHLALAQGPADDAGRVRAGRRLQDGHGLRHHVGRPDQRAADPVRLLHGLLQQGAVRQEGRRLPQDDGRDDGRGGQAARSGRRRRGLRRPRRAQRQRRAVDAAACRAGARRRSPIPSR